MGIVFLFIQVPDLVIEKINKLISSQTKEGSDTFVFIAAG